MAEELKQVKCYCKEKSKLDLPDTVKINEEPKVVTNINAPSSSKVINYEIPSPTNVIQSKTVVDLKENPLLLPKLKERRSRESLSSESSNLSSDISDSDAKYIRKVYRKTKALHRKQQTNLVNKPNPIKSAIIPEKKWRCLLDQ